MRFALVLMMACGAKPKAVEPPPPTCAQTADHMKTLLDAKDAELAKRIRDVFEARCELDAWSPDPRACVVATKSLDEKRGCKGKLTVGQREALDKDLSEAERLARAKKLPAACERYKQMIVKLAACDKLPQQSRDALQQGFDAMSQGWENIDTMPPEVRAAMEDGCKAAVDALDQAVGQTCVLKP